MQIKNRSECVYEGFFFIQSFCAVVKWILSGELREGKMSTSNKNVFIKYVYTSHVVIECIRAWPMPLTFVHIAAPLKLSPFNTHTRQFFPNFRDTEVAYFNLTQNSKPSQFIKMPSNRAQ